MSPRSPLATHSPTEGGKDSVEGVLVGIVGIDATHRPADHRPKRIFGLQVSHHIARLKPTTTRLLRTATPSLFDNQDPYPQAYDRKNNEN